MVTGVIAPVAGVAEVPRSSSALARAGDPLLDGGDRPGEPPAERRVAAGFTEPANHGRARREPADERRGAGDTGTGASGDRPRPRPTGRDVGARCAAAAAVPVERRSTPAGPAGANTGDANAGGAEPAGVKPAGVKPAGALDRPGPEAARHFRPSGGCGRDRRVAAVRCGVPVPVPVPGQRSRDPLAAEVAPHDPGRGTRRVGARSGVASWPRTRIAADRRKPLARLVVGVPVSRPNRCETGREAEGSVSR